MEVIDLETQRVLLDLYDQLENTEEISIGAPIYEWV